MIAFIEDQRAIHGVEPICKVLPIAPSTYHERVAQRRDPLRLSARARRDLALRVEVRRVFDTNYRVYGVRKVWRQLQREGFDVARCTIARLMRAMGLAGVIRGKPVRTTISDRSARCARDHVNRQFRAPAPDMLWVSDFTYVATWAGFVYVAFVIDTFARRIVGWRASRTAHAGFVLDALEQALHDRRPTHSGGLIHHSDRGSQGGLNRSSQHSNEGVCDERSKAEVGSMWTASVAVTWAAIGGSAGGAATVLDIHCDWNEQRRCGSPRWRIATCRNQMVPGGRRYATSDVQARSKAAVGQIPVLDGARGYRAAACSGS
jgi:putative transposase